jgi:hypothetical protein
MMPLSSQQALALWDSQDRELGRVVVDRVEGDLVFGRFTPGPGYPAVERLFAEYVEAANDQLLSIVGELDRAVAALGLHLRSPDKGLRLPPICDVQVGEGVITFRVRSQSGDAQPPDRVGGVPSPSPAPPDLRKV